MQPFAADFEASHIAVYGSSLQGDSFGGESGGYCIS